MVDNGADLIARVDEASILRKIRDPDEKWMSPLPHLLNNKMKGVIAAY